MNTEERLARLERWVEELHIDQQLSDLRGELNAFRAENTAALELILERERRPLVRWPTLRWSPIDFISSRYWWLFPAAMVGIGFAALLWSSVAFSTSAGPPALPTTPGSGWTAVGDGTRLQFRDLPDGVRCYRMYYSSELSCVQLKAQP